MAEDNKAPVRATHGEMLAGSPTTSAVLGKRALVLGGGGSAGNAWEIGVIAGLFEAGLDLTEADLIIGTSAGATAAAQLTSTPPPELVAAILAQAPSRAGPAGSDGGGLRGGSVADHLDRTGRVIAAAADPADMRRRLGEAALEMDAASDGSWSARWRATVAARLATPRWPDRRVLITAIDARTGDPVVFDRHSEVDLVDAVAASTSASLPYRIADGSYLDGGYRRNENADLAAGCERVLVLSPLAGRTRHPLEWGMQLSAQAEELRSAGSSVETVFPDADATRAFGSNMMDLSARPPAARAGCVQGRALGEQLGHSWR